jgi:hypothetical protein
MGETAALTCSGLVEHRREPCMQQHMLSAQIPLKKRTCEKESANMCRTSIKSIKDQSTSYIKKNEK